MHAAETQIGVRRPSSAGQQWSPAPKAVRPAAIGHKVTKWNNSQILKLIDASLMRLEAKLSGPPLFSRRWVDQHEICKLSAPLASGQCPHPPHPGRECLAPAGLKPEVNQFYCIYKNYTWLFIINCRIFAKSKKIKRGGATTLSARKPVTSVIGFLFY